MTLRDVLAWHVLPASLVEVLVEGDLPSAFGRLLIFAPLALEKGASLAFCGPSGSRWTLAVAKVAVSYVLREHHADAAPLVIVIGCEATPEGAACLTAWFKPCGVPVFRAATIEAVRVIMARKGSARPVLLDLPDGGIYAPGGRAFVHEVIE
ncbi:MAG: hypothetical protein ABF785_03105 [Acetobacter papayae]|uniref:hypothetical protein n=1 Tax=Acetobacter papayae TaxID=1076592 RepID=UPI0039ED8150